MTYKALKNTTFKRYKRVGKIYCPYLKTNEKRDLSSQKLRFALFPKALEVIKVTTTLQEYEKTQNVQYYGFIAIINGWKIKVIVKKNGDGPPFFWSVIPNWITNYKRDRLLHKGNMEKD